MKPKDAAKPRSFQADFYNSYVTKTEALQKSKLILYGSTLDQSIHNFLLALRS